MTPSEESITLMTPYRLPRHECTDPSRSFRMTTDAFLIMTPYRLRHYDAFRSPLLVTCFPKIVILNGARMLCEKAGKRDGEME